MQCIAKSKRTGEQCKRRAMKGKQVCMMHGGKSLSGIASPTFKDGRYSKAIPTQLAQHYEQALADPNLLGIKQDIALQDSLIFGALEGMSRGEAGELWKALSDAWKEYKKALAQQYKANPPDPQEPLDMVGFLIKEGYQDYMARIELRAMLQERAKLSDMEGKRLERAQQTITSVQAMSLMQAVVQAVLKHVKDPITLNNVQGELIRILEKAAS